MIMNRKMRSDRYLMVCTLPKRLCMHPVAICAEGGHRSKQAMVGGAKALEWSPGSLMLMQSIDQLQHVSRCPAKLRQMIIYCSIEKITLCCE